MDFPKIILTTNENLFELITSMYNLNHLKTAMNILSYEWAIDSSKVILVFAKDDIFKLSEYVFDNYIYEKIIYVGTAIPLSNPDLQAGDIVLPNTFLNDAWTIPIFIETNVWWNYDFNKFWLVLNGVCLTSTNNEDTQRLEFEADIKDNEVYSFVKSLNTQKNLENSVIIKIVTDKNHEDKAILENAIQAIDFVL